MAVTCLLMNITSAFILMLIYHLNGPNKVFILLLPESKNTINNKRETVGFKILTAM